MSRCRLESSKKKILQRCWLDRNKVCFKSLSLQRCTIMWRVSSNTKDFHCLGNRKVWFIHNRTLSAVVWFCHTHTLCSFKLLRNRQVTRFNWFPQIFAVAVEKLSEQQQQQPSAAGASGFDGTSSALSSPPKFKQSNTETQLKCWAALVLK